MNTNRINELVADWDEVYKKGQLTLWVLLAIFDGKKYSQEIADFMSEATNDIMHVKEQSLYRALRRFHRLGLVDVSKEPSFNGGPDHKYYRLTGDGKVVLKTFTRLHIQPLQSTHIVTLLTNLQEEEI